MVTKLTIKINKKVGYACGLNHYYELNNEKVCHLNYYLELRVS